MDQFRFENIRTMLTHPATVVGLSDGGAHCGLICDASMPTYQLSHWAKGPSPVLNNLTPAAKERKT